MDKKQPDIKEFKGAGAPGNPTVFSVADGNVIGCTTPEHMKAEAMTLEQFLRQVVDEATKHAEAICHKYDEGGELGWFPCGTAEVVLRWNQHREIIDLFKKTSNEGVKGDRDFWKGWFGRLFKTSSHGWWWTLPIPGSQSMKFQEAVCQFVRDKLLYRHIKVDVRTYID